MGRKYFDQQIGVDVTAATLSTAVTNLKTGVNAITYGTSGKASDMRLPNISYVGQQVTIVIDNNTTSLEANVNTYSTGDIFWGTTANTATIASTAMDEVALSLTAVTTAAWAVTSITSTGAWTMAATTGSTGQ